MRRLSSPMMQTMSPKGPISRPVVRSRDAMRIRVRLSRCRVLSVPRSLNEAKNPFWHVYQAF